MTSALRPCLLFACLAAVAMAPGEALADLPKGNWPTSQAKIAAMNLTPDAERLSPGEVRKQSRNLPNCSLAEEMPLCGSSEEVLAAIELERSLLAEQRVELAERRATLELAREQLILETDRLAAVRDEIAALLERVQTAQNEDLERLVRIYRNMTPEEAAAIIEDLDIETTVMVLGSMPERVAAPILANLDPMRARALSRIFLERSKLPADQDFSNIVLR
jgi:flagellar motility protein MotE (MotC chaperone)